jgi:hypothetical protein
VAVAARLPCDPLNGFAMAPRGLSELSSGGSMALELANWNVLDLGTGNGLFLHALFKQGYVLLCCILYLNFVILISWTKIDHYLQLMKSGADTEFVVQVH